MYDANFMKNNMLSCTTDERAKFNEKVAEAANNAERYAEPDFEKMISMKNGPYIVLNERNKMLIPENIAKEYTKLIRYEYKLYKKDHYPRKFITSKDENSNVENRIIYLKPRTVSLSDNYDEIADNISPPEDSEETKLVREAMNTLRVQNQLLYNIVFLHHFKRKTFVDIAEITGYTRQTISKKYETAKTELRNIIENSDNNNSNTDDTNLSSDNNQKAR